MNNTIALVVPRFGDKIIGGSERLFFNYAMLLTDKYNVDVITTGAAEYETWLSQYPLGKTEINKKLNIYRFNSDARWSSINTADSWNQYSIPHPGSDMLAISRNENAIKAIQNTPRYNAEKFIIEQGPYSKDLLQFLTLNHHKYKKVIFTPYLYPTTYLGIDRIPNNKVLILMAAHHEPHIYFPCFQKYAAYRWLVYFQEEATMLNVALKTNNTNWRIVKPSVGNIINNPNIKRSDNKVIFLGRASIGKGFEFVARAVDKYRLNHPEINMKLHVIGDIGDDVKNMINGWKDWIIPVGKVSTEKRDTLIAEALAVINGSVLDSFGLINLEAARLGTPVFLNIDCPAYESMHKLYPNTFIPFRSNDQDNSFEKGLHALRNKDILIRTSANLIKWATGPMSEASSLESLIKVIEE